MINIDAWLAALEERHLANLTRPELTRSLRALSSCYVERREKLTSGAALESSAPAAHQALATALSGDSPLGAIMLATARASAPPSRSFMGPSTS